MGFSLQADTRRYIKVALVGKKLQRWLDHIASGKTLAYLCKVNKPELEFGPVYNYIKKTPELKAAFEEAEKAYADYKFQECIPIADEVEDVARAKLMIDTRMKTAAKLNREKFGDDAGVNVNLGSNSLIAILQSLPRTEIPAIESKSKEG